MSILSSLTGAGTASGSNASSAASSNASTSAATVATQYQTFLKMLTTELQNQDPTQPLDSSQFTSQLAQFSSLEQQLQTNSNLSNLITAQQSATFNSAIGYIGHSVQASGDSFTANGSGNSVPLAFSLAGTATSAKIDILNAAGQTVSTLSVQNPAVGMNTLTFKGQDANGNPLPAGTYTFAVSATDQAGKSVAATTYETGTVTGVNSANGATTLQLGTSGTVPVSQVVQVTS
jgi:flagellar basal-body rod modification protein FlgD